MKTNQLVLNFNCTCWQNRKARIYMNGPEFDVVVEQTLRKKLDNGNTRIVLSRSQMAARPTQVVLADGSVGVMFTDDGFSPFHCEWQVWKKSKNGSYTLFLEPDPDVTPHPSSLPTGLGQDNIATTRLTTDSAPNADKTLVQIATPHSNSSLMASAPAPPPSHAPMVVERALRSRVAYSERPMKNSSLSQPREDSIRMANVSLCNDRVYCTIDCMKGLKVQSLAIVCIFRIGNKIFSSGFTSFPPPSSLKRKERSRVSKPKRSSPYQRRSDDEGDEDLEETFDFTNGSSDPVSEDSSKLDSSNTVDMDLMVAPLTSHDMPKHVDTAGPSNLTSAAPPNTINYGKVSPDPSTFWGVSQNAPQQQIRPTFIPRFSPSNANADLSFTPHRYLSSDGSSFANQNSWTTVLNRLKVIATAYAEQVLSSISLVAQLQSNLASIPMRSSLQQLSHWALSGGVALESKLVSGLLDIFAHPSFVGSLDNKHCYELLSAYISPHSNGHFLIRLSQTDPGWLEIYGLFRPTLGSDPSLAPFNEYCATIKYQLQHDPHLPAILWIDTEANAQESRCHHIAALATFVSNITGWTMFERSNLPSPNASQDQISMSNIGSANSLPSASTAPQVSWNEPANSSSLAWYENLTQNHQALDHFSTGRPSSCSSFEFTFSPLTAPSGRYD